MIGSLLRTVILMSAGVWFMAGMSVCCGQQQAAGEEFFEQRIRPILVQRCEGCHSRTAGKAGGGLLLDHREGWSKGGDSGTAIIPGQPDASLLIQAVRYAEDGPQMPPQSKGGKLPDAEIRLLEEWVRTGAVDPRVPSAQLGGMSPEQARTWWAFQPLPLPHARLQPADLDRALQRLWQQQGLSPAPPADARTLLRRLHYDLTGLAPAMHDVDAFAAEPSAAAWQAQIERLLQSPQYGVHWGRHWLDVVRYADTAGENTDRPLPHAWRYRNWVMQSLNADLPFDQFARLQLAGDLLPEGPGQSRADGIVATGYLAIARRFGHDIDKDIHLMYEDVIDNLGKNFLGLTLGCARCHDHKYDPITAEDYYALYGVFDSTKFSFPGCEPKGQPKDLVPLADAAVVAQAQQDYQQRLAAFEQRQQQRDAGRLAVKQLAAASHRILAGAAVGEGQTVTLQTAVPQGQPGGLESLSLKRGEVLQLAILPNGNYGADTTRVQLEIRRTSGSQPASWSLQDLIDGFAQGGPLRQQRDAAWCFLEVTDGPQFLTDGKPAVEGRQELSAWARGDNPAVFVNQANQQVDVWTRLPARTVFVHPGPDRPVAIAWVCPEDGLYQVQGLVEDAHPAALDGVSFRFEHFANPEIGPALVALGQAVAVPAEPRPSPPVFPVAYAVFESSGKNARVHVRGDPEQPGAEVPRRWLTTFGCGLLTDAAGGSGRVQLAEAVVRQPLFARVIVNRVWQWHFGRGLVASANDFGSRGAAPLDVQLLDLLAADFVAGGYRLKDLHRLILSTDAWRLSSRTAGAADLRDSENQYQARFSRRRLTAEELRDAVLAASGGLNPDVPEGHPFPPESTWTFSQHAPFNAVYDSPHRSAFLMVQRQRRHPYLALFDGADPNSSTAQRQSTTVPTQALYFLNDAFFHQQGQRIAERAELSGDDGVAVQQLYQVLLQRRPEIDEQALAVEFLAGYPGTVAERRAAWVRVLMSSSEFSFVD
ncbi:MAG: PSD1 and planctomycete cytochrome C domain-containing protein [Planctomyces sp.]